MNDSSTQLKGVRGSVRLLPVRTFTDARGSLSVVEGGDHVPFVPHRMYYLHGGASNRPRGAHAHYVLQQFMIAVSGAFAIDIDDGYERKTYELDRPDVGLLVQPMIWRDIRPKDSHGVLIVLASAPFDMADYLHDYDQFRALARAAIS